MFEPNSPPMEAALFDLDGVIVDTARHHFLAWQRLAHSLGIEFTAADNEQLKGVSRKQSLELILALGKQNPSEAEKQELATRKNAWYVELIAGISPADALPGAIDYLKELRKRRIKIALGSASRNSPLILRGLGITGLFDAIIDGNSVSASKPDPEVFLAGARSLGVVPARCTVFEDSLAGIEAARRAGMRAVGIGDPRVLTRAHQVVPDLQALLAS